MNLHFLRVFFTVATNGSFSRAAKELYITQPAVSRGVQELERELAVTLLDRSAHGIVLTQAGHILFEHAEHIFTTERFAYIALEQLQGLERGQLSIGASNTIGTYLLPPLLGIFHRRYPNIRLNLEIGNTTQIAQRLRAVPFDIALVEGPIDAPDLVITPWRVDRLVVIAASDHPLTKQSIVKLEQLLEEPFIYREPQSATRAAIEAALQKRNARLKVAMELGSNQAVKQAVSAGLGIAIVSEATVGLEVSAGTLAILSVPDLDLTRSLTQALVIGRWVSPALNAFLEFITGD